MAVKRFGVSLEEDVLTKLDEIVEKESFPNRSQAIRFLVRRNDLEHKWKGNEEVAGSIILVYDHHKRDIQKQLTHIQHDYQKFILASQHVHLNHHDCLETIAIKGKAEALLKLTDNLKAVKGIKYCDMVMSNL